MITFRTIQALTGSTITAMWIVRSLTHPGFHPMLLVFAVVTCALSELSYRAGKNAKDSSSGVEHSDR